MQNESFVGKLKMFGRFPKSDFSFDTEEFVNEYFRIISSEELFDELLTRMCIRYGKNEIEKAQVIGFVKELNHFNLNEDKLRELLTCDKNLIFSIGQEMETSIRLFAQKAVYRKKGKVEFMIDEFGFSPKTFNYLLKRGYNTKSAVLQAYRNGYITGEKVKNEIKERLLIGKVLDNLESEIGMI